MVNTSMCFEGTGLLMTWADAVSGNARIAGEKSARDQHALVRGAGRPLFIQARGKYVPTVVPTQNVAPSAQRRSP